MVDFPNVLTPSYFNIDKLPDYGMKIVEDELGVERRIFTETTGHNTELRVRYTGMSADEVQALIVFYQSVRGTFGTFTLPPEFFPNPAAYNTAIDDLEDTVNWRFITPPVIETVIKDIYTTEFTILSLKNEQVLNVDQIFGFFEPIQLNLNLARVSTTAEEDVGATHQGLSLTAPFLSFVEAAIPDPLTLNLTPATIAVASERAVNAPQLSFGFVDLSGSGEFTVMIAPSMSFGTIDATGVVPDVVVASTPTISSTAASIPITSPDQATISLATLTLNPSTVTGESVGLIPIDPASLTLNTPPVSGLDTGVGVSTQIVTIVPSPVVLPEFSVEVTAPTLSFGEFFMPFVFSNAGIGMSIQHRNSNFNAFANGIFIVDTSSAAITSQLPSSPENSTAIIFADCKGSITTTSPTGFGLNSLTINPGAGDTIQDNSDLSLEIDNMGVTLVYDSLLSNWFIIANSF